MPCLKMHQYKEYAVQLGFRAIPLITFSGKTVVSRHTLMETHN